MAVSGERSTDRKALVEAAAGAVHDQNGRARADGRVLDRSARRRDKLARAGKARACGGEGAPVEPVARHGARRSNCEHAETELVFRALHALTVRRARGVRHS